MKVLCSNEFYDLHRGEKDFIIPETIADMGYDCYLLSSKQVSLFDETAGFGFHYNELNERVKHKVKIVYYQAWRLVKKTHNKKVSFLFPNIFSYLFGLWCIHPDIVIESIYTTLTPRSYLNWLYCIFTGNKRVLMDAGDEAANKKLLPFERAVMNQASAIFSYSRGGIERIKNKYNMFNYTKYFVQLKVLNPNRFYFLPVQNSNKEKITIGYIGRLVKLKGFDKFLEIAEKLGKEDYNFIVAGVNEDNFILPQWIDYKNYIDPEKIGDLYREIDFLFLPDMTKFNSYATVIQEGVMCGCIVCIGSFNTSFYPEVKYLFIYNPKEISSPIDYIRNIPDIQLLRMQISSYYGSLVSIHKLVKRMIEI